MADEDIVTRVMRAGVKKLSESDIARMFEVATIIYVSSIIDSIKTPEEAAKVINRIDAALFGTLPTRYVTAKQRGKDAYIPPRSLKVIEDELTRLRDIIISKFPSAALISDVGSKA